jgi:dTDP-4-dehydrorhamnose reductase
VSVKIVLLGGSGLLGSAVLRHFEQLAGMKSSVPAIEIIAPRHAELDLLNAESVRHSLVQHQPDVVINCTAYSQVDLAEDEPAPAYALNRDAVANLVQACDAVQASLIHFSTDFVFDGLKGSAYVETDATNALGVYGASKLAGEQAVLSSSGAHFVFRVSWLYGPGGKNFFSGVRDWLQQERHLPIVSDQTSAPNDVTNLARVLHEWLAQAAAHSAGCRAFFLQHRGLYHFSAPQVMSRYEFAQQVALELKERGITVKATMEAVPASRFPMKAKRPKDSGLDSNKFVQRFGIQTMKK